jgi:hypothetical protein
MVNDNLKSKPDWYGTLMEFEVGECFQYQVENSGAEKAKLRQVIRRIKQNTKKDFTTNTLLGGGFEIKRTK